MDYLLYEAEDFAADESYLNYYFRLSKTDIAFWEDWMRLHPEKLDLISQADHLIGLMAMQLPDQELQEEFRRIERGVGEQSPTGQQQALQAAGGTVSARESPLSVAFDNVLRIERGRRLRRLVVAVSAAVVLISLGYVYFFKPHTDDALLPIASAGAMLERTNLTSGPMNLTLEDGTFVTLDPGSKLVCPAHFPADRREIYLEGGGFFKVSKSARQPFYVYYGNFVTHVLGTSFTIRMDKRREQVEVAVLTGKVEVYKRPRVNAEKDLREQGDLVILTPNQRAIYRESEQRFETSLVEKPRPVRPDTAFLETPAGDPGATVFNTATLADIIGSFEKTYSIDIEMENEGINNCHFSGDLSGMDLYKQLDVICQSLNMSYEVIGTRILIRGRGCN